MYKYYIIYRFNHNNMNTSIQTFSTLHPGNAYQFSGDLYNLIKQDTINKNLTQGGIGVILLVKNLGKVSPVQEERLTSDSTIIKTRPKSKFSIK